MTAIKRMLSRDLVPRRFSLSRGFSVSKLATLLGGTIRSSRLKLKLSRFDELSV